MSKKYTAIASTTIMRSLFKSKTYPLEMRSHLQALFKNRFTLKRYLALQSLLTHH
ncbi:hypothetical protein QUB80_17065 [Chlorogloeopsis sp. ULAP01]|uniref:hypothetical protein n=1 Tax=Chlorogloeopsis sp. ULAP01 TaxID=3056483 RepID=UPI0025AAE43C|nr:hypothetical protein [Chlorogloeopsis sp. ULAP01]MDM9382415.1 hypothetical protein [Chlorogloeopsis sp. ULAP01]